MAWIGWGTFQQFRCTQATSTISEVHVYCGPPHPQTTRNDSHQQGPDLLEWHHAKISIERHKYPQVTSDENTPDISVEDHISKHAWVWSVRREVQNLQEYGNEILVHTANHRSNH